MPDICADIGGYIAPFGKTWTVIPDREEAVERAILEADTPAVVVLAGKGAEQQQKRKKRPRALCARLPAGPSGSQAL